MASRYRDRIDELSRHLGGPSLDAQSSRVARYLLTAKSSGRMKLTVQGKDKTPRDIEIAVNDANRKIIPASREGDASVDQRRPSQ